jgi:hypothetical protein
MGARRYGADPGRFLEQDLFMGALSDLGLTLDPLTQNRYALAGGNPISFAEWDGHLLANDGSGGSVREDPPNRYPRVSPRIARKILNPSPEPRPIAVPRYQSGCWRCSPEVGPWLRARVIDLLTGEKTAPGLSFSPTVNRTILGSRAMEAGATCSGPLGFPGTPIACGTHDLGYELLYEEALPKRAKAVIDEFFEKDVRNECISQGRGSCGFIAEVSGAAVSALGEPRRRRPGLSTGDWWHPIGF